MFQKIILLKKKNVFQWYFSVYKLAYNKYVGLCEAQFYKRKKANVWKFWATIVINSD